MAHNKLEFHCNKRLHKPFCFCNKFYSRLYLYSWPWSQGRTRPAKL